MAVSAVTAAELLIFVVPATVPGGNPVTEVPGERPRSPASVVAPVLVTVVAARTEYAPAVPNCTPLVELASSNCGGDRKELPNTTRVTPSGMSGQRFRFLADGTYFVFIVGTVALFHQPTAVFLD
ncbi:hypothetical protein FEAC_02270 [Ferrimicrobium acidiphilum DSM 19497]|uniref:Uncharacterized protein n=1 Tax=Ferrimicrobium acidiphilum DSM 19497 TaxID=1121877 RepID=A0A0D8FXB0_9ACTN|nr:hypothetical protein FEAC_02270 [Ferrimicrobium acidiphilum DSM 19497]